VVALRHLHRRGYSQTLLGALILAVYLFPVYWMVATSLKSARNIFATPPILLPFPPVLDSYSQVVFNNPALHRAVLNSVILGVGTVVLTLFLATPAAYALARLKLRITAVVVLVLLVSQMLPSINLAVPLFAIFSNLELVNSYTALILANTIWTLPFAIIVLRPFFLGVPGDLEAAAMVDGCTQLGAFYRVVLPLVTPGLITVSALAFVHTWGEFTFGLTLTTSEEMQPVTVALNEFNGEYGTRWNDLMAVSSTVALPIVVVFVLLQRHIVGGLTTGATKG
jgi:multiple sugar transport system permease protein